MALDDYIAQADLEARVGASVVLRAFDDDNDGIADTAAIVRLCKDACSMVNSYLFPIYSAQMPMTAPYPPEVVRLSLDVAVAMMGQRRSQTVKLDWQPMMEQAQKELERLRAGKTRLNLTYAAPEQAANKGGSVRSGDPLLPAPGPKFFANGTGDF